jgi:heme/copper-type cytochrome/quinol oxidase subunit 2
MCSVVAAGVLVTVLLAVWSTRRGAEPATALAPSLASELVWTAIPSLMLLAAAIPAVMAFVSK